MEKGAFRTAFGLYTGARRDKVLLLRELEQRHSQLLIPSVPKREDLFPLLIK